MKQLLYKITIRYLANKSVSDWLKQNNFEYYSDYIKYYWLYYGLDKRTSKVIDKIALPLIAELKDCCSMSDVCIDLIDDIEESAQLPSFIKLLNDVYMSASKHSAIL